MRATCIQIAAAAGLTAGRTTAKEQLFNCPRHDDQHPTLSINPEKNCFNCPACNTGGNWWKFAAFIAGVDPNDKSAVAGWLRKHGLSNAIESKTDADITATYPYTNETGALLYEVVRFTPKAFSQRRPNGNGGWVWNLNGTRRVLYQLPEVLKASYIFIVEGEKDVEALRGLGLTATTNPQGAGKWCPEYTNQLQPPQHIVIIPDNDEPGRKHAADIALSVCGRVASVKVLELPGLPPKGDVSDWLVGRDPETAAEDLSRLADAAPAWKPSDPKQGFEPPPHWRILDVSTLKTWEVTSLRPIVNGLIARGNFVIVAAPTQTGKTLLDFYIARKMVQGGPPLFGNPRFTIAPVDRAGYFVLEDPDRRIHARLLDTDDEFPEPLEQGKLIFYVAPGFALNDDPMFNWLESVIQTKLYDVIFIDTYQRATPGLSSFNDEEQSIILHRLANLTRKLGVTIVIIDHVRKMDSKAKRNGLSIDDLKGTGGKAQNADCVILMERAAERGHVRFQSFSKDFDQPVGILLKIAPEGSREPKFQYIADLDQLGTDAATKGQQNRSMVLQSMSPGKWVSSSDVAQTTTMSDATARRHLKSLVEAGQVDETGTGRWKRYARINQSEEISA